MLIGGGLQQLASGEPVAFPDNNLVRFADGTVRSAKRFMPVVDAGNHGENVLINMNALPLSPFLEEIEIVLEEEDEIGQEKNEIAQENSDLGDKTE